MAGFKSGSCYMVPWSLAGPFHNRVHGFPYLDFYESGYRFYCIANADFSLSSPYSCSSRQWFNSSLTAFSFYFQEIKWRFTCCVILCVVLQCYFSKVIRYSSALFFALIYIHSSSVISPQCMCPIISCLSLYLRACAFLCSYLPGIPCLYLLQSPLVLMSSFPDASQCSNDVKMRCELPIKLI